MREDGNWREAFIGLTTEGLGSYRRVKGAELARGGTFCRSVGTCIRLVVVSYFLSWG